MYNFFLFIQDKEELPISATQKKYNFYSRPFALNLPAYKFVQ